MAYVFQVDTDGTLNTGLVSYFKLEDTTDIIGSNGLSDGGSTTFSTGKVGNAAYGDGSADYLTNASPTGLPTGANVRSISLWYYHPAGEGAAAPRYHLGYGTAATRQAFEFYTYRYQEFGFDVYTNSAYRSSAGVLTADTWYHFVLAYDGTDVKIWMNGSAQTLTGATVALNTGTTAGFNILVRGTTGANYSTGRVDEVGIWSKVLSAQEITDLYNGGSGQTMVVSSSVKTYNGLASASVKTVNGLAIASVKTKNGLA